MFFVAPLMNRLKRLEAEPAFRDSPGKSRQHPSHDKAMLCSSGTSVDPGWFPRA
jgi:hypothetical protein